MNWAVPHADSRDQKILSMHELAINLEAAACSYDVHFEETQELQLTQVRFVQSSPAPSEALRSILSRCERCWPN